MPNEFERIIGARDDSAQEPAGDLPDPAEEKRTELKPETPVEVVPETPVEVTKETVTETPEERTTETVTETPVEVGGSDDSGSDSES